MKAIVSARVGGAYWAAQPTLPVPPYTVIRLRDGDVRAAAAKSRDGQTLLWWLDDRLEGSMSECSVHGPCDPWHLISGAEAVVTDPDDELLLVAALAGVRAESADGSTFLGAADEAKRERMVEAVLERFSYIDPFTGEPMTLVEAVELCAFWRRLIDSNRPIAAAIGFASWKKPTAAPLLWAGTGDVPFTNRLAGLARGSQVAAWKSRVPAATIAQADAARTQLVEVEDGFIRSIGLGADCVPPLSLVVDRVGIFFDPQHPSALENLLQDGCFPADLLARARRLRHFVTELGVSKYSVDNRGADRRAGERRHVLVPGQVEDDRSVLTGGGSVRTNLDLLRKVRHDAPDAYILYKPHPDVEAGHRLGAIRAGDSADFADEVVRGGSISALIDMVDEVHVNTSLAGFEALMRSKPVTTHGVPFYAGWGLTRDLGAVPARRSARRTLDELVAATLLLYPRYLDPLTGLPCTAEILVRRLAETRQSERATPLVALRRLQGQLKRGLSSFRAW